MTKLICPECQHENEPERMYCHSCGARLDRSKLAPTTAAVDDLRQVLVDTGAVDRVEAMITTGCQEALAALAGSAVAPEAVAALTDLALAATARQA